MSKNKHTILLQRAFCAVLKYFKVSAFCRAVANVVFVLCFMFSFFPPSVGAAAPPIPVSKKRALAEVDQKIEEKKGLHLELQGEVKSLDKALRDNRSFLKKLGRSVQENEKELLLLEDRIDSYEGEQALLGGQLRSDYKSMGQFILAMNRLENVPIEALVLRPEAPLKTAQSALVMQNIMTSLNSRSHRLRDNIERYQYISTSLKEDRSLLFASLARLRNDRQKLARFISQKEMLYRQSKQDIKLQELEIARMSEEARSVKDLMKGLRKKREKERAEKKKRKSLSQIVYEAPGRLLSGQSQLPISGIIRVGYNQPDHLNAPSKGLWIEGRQNSLVVSPMKGEVRFAGYFKGYGNLIIIEHGDNYHSLIAGLEKIDTKVGYTVAAGEPLGYLGSVLDGQKPRLYFELHRRGKVINPSEKFSGIS